MPTQIFNANPTVFAPARPAGHNPSLGEDMFCLDGDHNENDEITEIEPIDQDEIFDLIRSINDPEHPNTLEELRVVSAPQIEVAENRVTVEFTPTVPHCGMSTLIGKSPLSLVFCPIYACDTGLSIRVRLLRSLPNRFKIDIFLKPGSHQSEHAVNKQLNDKERVAAALENPLLVETLEQCLASAGRRGLPPD